MSEWLSSSIKGNQMLMWMCQRGNLYTAGEVVLLEPFSLEISQVFFQTRNSIATWPGINISRHTPKRFISYYWNMFSSNFAAVLFKITRSPSVDEWMKKYGACSQWSVFKLQGKTKFR